MLDNMLIPEFPIVDISESDKSKHRVKWRILLPKGTKVGYAVENKLVLEKDQGLEITGVRKVVEKGIEK
ncbi:hypothetical protein COK29_26785, partial [Bacillus cereus]